MVFSHTDSLFRLINQIIDIHQNNDFPFSNSDLEVVRDHAPIFNIPDFMEKKRFRYSGNLLLRKKELYQTRYENLFLRKQFRNLNGGSEWMVSFFQDLKEVFKVPKLNRPRNVQVANFIGFLVQLLINKLDLFSFDTYLVIVTELQYFSTILLDSPFQSTENHLEVQTLLFQFETLANECGKLVYSFLFSPYPPPVVKIDEILSKPIMLLKVNVIKFFNSPTYINTTPNTLQFAMSSVFIVGSFLYDLENLINQEDNSILEVKNYVEKLHRSLKHPWSLLNKHYDVIDELKQILMLAFDAEYLINYFLWGDAPAWYLGLRLPHIIHSVELIGSRLPEMDSDNDDDDWVLPVGDDFGAGLSLQTRINSGMDETMVGFEDEEQKILDDLFGGGEMQIISIVGMPGLGKTTLAKKIYNHPTVRSRFDRISWCIVSQAYRMKKILVEILKGLDSQVKEATLAGESEEEVGLRIYQTLKDRRYLIVVDDIWELRAWEDIKIHLPDDGNGSRILLTSRNKELADHFDSSIHALPLLSDDQCWELLQRKVFHVESCPPELENTGVNIAAQCNGLPLVVVVVAGILSTIEKDLSTWENVRQTLDSNIFSYQDEAVAKSLELSYMYLPLYLKSCFLYFGRFRGDEQIIVKEVVRLWIAEGFIMVDKRKKAEDIANEYMKELIGKNLVMVVKKNYKGEAIVCIVHDLLRDMCLKIAKDDNFMTIGDGDNSACGHGVQRMISHYSSYSNSNRWLGWCLPYSKCIRSFVYHDEELYPQLKVGHMNVLRVLEISKDLEYSIDCDDNVDQKYIGYECGIQNLVHLRHLNIFNMPEPIGRFSSLEFLIVATKVEISSSFLDAMMKLRYLRAQMVYVDDIDWNTSRTYNLEYLSKLVISSQEGGQQWKVFPHLRRLVCINDDQELTFDFRLFIRLESLTLHPWNLIEIRTTYLFPSTIIKLSLNSCCLSQEHMSMIGALPKLEVFKLECFTFLGKKWETRDDEFQKLKYLKLEFMFNPFEWNVSSWEHFPVLRHLIIKDCSGLKELPSEIGYISMLQLISVTGWGTPQLKESVHILKELLQDEGNEDVKIVEELDEKEQWVTHGI